MQVLKLSLVLFLAAILAKIFEKHYEEGKNSHLDFGRNYLYLKSLKVIFWTVRPQNMAFILSLHHYIVCVSKTLKSYQYLIKKQGIFKFSSFKNGVNSLIILM